MQLILKFLLSCSWKRDYKAMIFLLILLLLTSPVLAQGSFDDEDLFDGFSDTVYQDHDYSVESEEKKDK